ncbi:MAG: NAD(P)-dependent oxidoreductase [Hoeflea sp.]|uniref:NAD-dependent epimerase/dehydratase family protein n=1 Tax=Hoeflea sp. TaxID=1940281 RepID=UPI001DDAF040|nr:NAD(P)-dependent oxidoreductase [Hoeflea sp.]MBU4530768.1 NAD(P)-dependent oxidoreductase [Alphaproteobacteria bacterium]MBU4544767.1 NAD(P)-dependent oxidoreductase [Alphaproteobacteria bacterium]MBU4549323.1 NAD(P)-dependent oxidoreductase [Alphaproteobacteria bacterium]MBV1726362.1 NAD(P)-dependent oxidoreductase [Hoeflea sp.]MBV1761704.1 NAD(P)-dependent oxidoreductase [Hoeflea sp.]
MTTLVTGGSGLVGRYIVEALLGAGYDVAVAGRTPPQRDLFSAPVGFRAFTLDAGDHPDTLFEGASSLVHAAFDHLPGRYRGGEGDDPDAFRRRNLEGSVRLFEAAKQAGIRRAVFLSSRAVYDGLASGIPLTEAAALAPASLYGAVKLGCEQALAALNGPNFCTASLRLTGVYGDLRPNKWDQMIADYLAGKPVPVRAGSEVHGRDVGRAVRLMLEADAARVGGAAFNVSDLVVDTRDILSGVREASGSPHPLPGRGDTAAVAEMECGKIRGLGWEPGGRDLFDATLADLAKPGP